MALLVLLFLDLATMPDPKGDNADKALYRQAMSDHHLKGSYWLQGHYLECARVMKGSLPDALYSAFDLANRRPAEAPNGELSFSWVGWYRDQALFQLTTSYATSCLLYRRAGPASFRLVREVRLPH